MNDLRRFRKISSKSIKSKTEHMRNPDKTLAQIKIVKSCMAAMTSAIPPAFCWKTGGDIGVIPLLCPKGYFRFLALCYKEC